MIIVRKCLARSSTAERVTLFQSTETTSKSGASRTITAPTCGCCVRLLLLVGCCILFQSTTTTTSAAVGVYAAQLAGQQREQFGVTREQIKDDGYFSDQRLSPEESSSSSSSATATTTGGLATLKVPNEPASLSMDERLLGSLSSTSSSSSSQPQPPTTETRVADAIKTLSSSSNQSARRVAVVGKIEDDTSASTRVAGISKRANGANSNANDGQDREVADDVSNTTLLIDYDQQGYSLPPLPATREDSIVSQSAPTATTEATATTTTTTTTITSSRLIETTGRIDKEETPIVSTESIPAPSGRFVHESDEKELKTIDHKSYGRSQVSATTTSAAQDDYLAKPVTAKLVVVGSALDERSASTPSDSVLVSPAIAAAAAQTQALDERQAERASGGSTSASAAASLRAKPEGPRDLRGARFNDKTKTDVTSGIFDVLLKKNPYSKFWSAEKKWDDLYRRVMTVQGKMKDYMVKSFMKDVEYYADLAITESCADDLKYIQNYIKRSTNFRWLLHMFDSTGKSESGMLTGNMANLGHPIQCIKVRAPLRPSNYSFDERYFEQQTEMLGERFRGKYCLASVRPVLPEKPYSVSRFSEILDLSLISNISFMGLPAAQLKLMSEQTAVPNRKLHQIIQMDPIDRIPFESQLYQYLIDQRNFAYSLPRAMGVCYPSSCTREDIRVSLQKTLDEQHQVVDIEFECEQEEKSAWDFLSSTPRLVAYVFLFAFVTISFGASLARYIIVDKMRVRLDKLPKESTMFSLISILNLMSMDKCAGLLFVKTKTASPIVDKEKPENNRSTSIDALKGFLILVLVYSELIHLGCLPVPFMYSKWAESMFPFFRSWLTQIFINSRIWSEAFYIMSAYLIGLKLLENHRPSASSGDSGKRPRPAPNFMSFALKRYVRLLLPMVAFILLNYVWPRLSNGFVMQDQANKLMKPCDSYGWTNVLLFHNHNNLNETCLWPSFVSASFFQLHLLSYPVLMLMLHSLNANYGANSSGARRLRAKLLTYSGLALATSLALLGLIYQASVASSHKLVVPFLIDYIDYDNYRRVIEFMVTPTHNHLTSYMVGLMIAYQVARRRAQRELKSSSMEVDFGACGNYAQSEASYESSVSSSMQTLDHRRHQQQNSMQQNSSTKLAASSQQFNDSTSISSTSDHRKEEQSFTNWLASLLVSGFFLVVILISLTASWFWNGLGQPMSASQTFWYLILTKLTFSLGFAYLFHKHFATRRNCNNPWMLTRFLVPIGRMSLTVFYVSWLVIWFDLLASLYQWHPSHYFVLEKFHEIIFITLILGMFVYGTFEGVVKNIQYASLRDEVKRKQKLVDPSSTSCHEQQQQQIPLDNHLHGFDAMFSPTADDDALLLLYTRNLALARPKGQLQGDKVTQSQSIGDDGAKQQQSSTGSRQQLTLLQPDPSGIGGSSSHLSVQAGRKPLSMADQYKLNAELRANYSFASIGLYESAGATADLTHSSEPQTSPPQSHKRV